MNTYERITNIYYGNNDIEISTYVDLRYHHYIISHPYIIPPIVDKNFTTFKPHPVIKTNQELKDTKNVKLTVFDITFSYLMSADSILRQQIC